jgi:hypothetical protein
MSVSGELRHAVLSRDQNVCQYCNQACSPADRVIEHVVPAALGGPDALYNLVVACRSCNTRKSQGVWIPRNLEHLTAGHPHHRALIIAASSQVYTYAPAAPRTGDEWIVLGAEWQSDAYGLLRDLAVYLNMALRDLLDATIWNTIMLHGLRPAEPQYAAQLAQLWLQRIELPADPADQATVRATLHAARDELTRLLAQLSDD